MVTLVRFSGQASTEYLILLGAVLLVSVVVVSSLSTGLDSSSTRLGQSQSYWQSASPFGVLSAKAVDGALVFELKNSGAERLVVTGVNADGTDLMLYSYGAGDTYPATFCTYSGSPSCSIILAPGESKVVAAQGIPTCSGSSFEVTSLRITYSNGPVSSMAFVGAKPLLGSCSSKVCDSGWLKVPGNASLLVADFCVMKYPAKCASSSTGTACSLSESPVSQWNNRPWVSINQTNAAAACARLGDGYHLITDREWVALATNVANVGDNWNSSAVGAGCLYGGHMDNNPSATLENSADDLDGWNGTGDSSSDPFECPFDTSVGASDGKEQRRTMYLSTGEVIWDLSGNVYEWTGGSVYENRTSSSYCVPSSNCSSDPDGITGGQMPSAGVTTSTNAYQFTSVTSLGSLGYAQPPGSWNSNFGAGKIYLNPGFALSVTNNYDSDVHGFLRGGRFYSSSTAGIFSLAFDRAPSVAWSSAGFRCAR